MAQDIMDVPATIDVAAFIVNNCYPQLANHPMFPSRSREFKAVTDYCAHYGVVVTEPDFENALADRFGDGCEYEFPQE